MGSESAQAFEGREGGRVVAGAEAQPGFVGDDSATVGIDRAGTPDGLQRLRVIAVRVERGRIPVQRLGRVRVELQRDVEVAKRGGRVTVPPPRHERLVEPGVGQLRIEGERRACRSLRLRIGDFIAHRAEFAQQQQGVGEPGPAGRTVRVALDQLVEPLFRGGQALGRAGRELEARGHVGFARPWVIIVRSARHGSRGSTPRHVPRQSPDKDQPEDDQGRQHPRCAPWRFYSRRGRR